jgi:Protein of unknown function (DUF3300)
MRLPNFVTSSTTKISRLAALALATALALGTVPLTAHAQDAQDGQSQDGPQQQATSQSQQQPYTAQTAQQLDQLVAPIALYPDSLVAQVLAASTFPDQIVEADRWVQANPGLKDQALADAVNNQPWDPSVKALCAFPSVLGNMDKNLSWTSSLGDAYYNQQQDVMNAIQVMRQKAQTNGQLNSSSQQTVSSEGSQIVIQPANPQVVYVPAYNPWVVYGYPVAPWPGWYPYPGIWYGGPYISWGVGFGIGFWGGYGWGWGHWGFNWHGGYPLYGGNRYYSVSRTFYNRNAYYRSGGYNGRYGAASTRGAFDNHGQYAGGNRGAYGGNHGVYDAHGYNGQTHPFGNDTHAARGYGNPGGTNTGTRSGAFSGYGQGGAARTYSSRGSSSFGGGGGGGGFHGGGGGGGGHAGGGGGHH